jgi:hypothetical protein
MTKGGVRKRKRRQLTENSTIREPSKFEIVEAEINGDRKAATRPAKKQRQDRTVILPGGYLEYTAGGAVVQF